MVETELLQPVAVRLVEQQRAEQPGSADICGLQSTLNVQQETAESTSVPQQKAEAVDSHSSQNMVDVQTPFWQLKAGELCPADFCSLQSMLDAQRDKIHEQLQELQKVVVLQCRITGTNPLAQEMAAAVLEKRIGKRFGESLTPKALKCLYNVFSIKDTITKKEAREISALCGATVTQVREFFAGQRSRVRKVVQSSHIDQGSDDTFLKLQSTELDQSAVILHSGEDTLSLSSQQVESRQCNHLLLLDAFQGREDGISSKLHAVEKAEHLINVMHKESTFTGQSQLAQVIMQAHESVLRCFMARGGLQQINKWLIQAAAEEQTSLIRIMLKAITQLPLGSALPRHMSLLLQTVNKLRFYRAQDIASRARLLLSRWSRFFKSSQNGKLGSFTGVARTTQPGQKRARDSTNTRSIEDVSKKKVKVDIVVDSGQSSDVVSSSLTEDKTMQERDKPEAVIEINKSKKRLGSFLIHGDRPKEKRKVQLFEASQAGMRRKDGEGTRASSFESSSRPLSADDIKKAKRRAYFLSKSQKPSSSSADGSTALDLWSLSGEGGQRKTMQSAGNYGGVHEPVSGENCSDSALTSMEGRHSENALKHRINPKVSGVLAGQHADLSMSMNGKALNVANKSAQNTDVHRVAEVQGISGPELNGSELSMGIKQSEPCQGTDAMDMPTIPWTTPPRITLDPRWKTASGDHSTEIESESKRLRNELEAIYLSPQFIPSSPAEPAERLCLFVDDASVPEILLEALDEESQEKDSSLPSPRDLEWAKVRGEEADSQKSIANIDCKAHDEMLCSSRKGIDRSVALEMPFKDTHTPEVIATKDLQSSLLSETTEFNCNKPVKKADIATDPTKNFYVDPSELTLATPVEQACMEPMKIGYCNPEAYQQGGGTPCIQLKNREAAPVCRDPTPFETYTVCKASAAEPLLSTLWEKDIPSSLPNDSDKASSSLAANTEVPSRFANAGSHTNTPGVDLSELSKEDCMDMLNIVLQQLTDNAKASGADLELLSVFLKNPQLVYSLMSSHVGPSGKGFSSASTEKHLSEIMAGNTIEDINNQLEKLAGRNIGQVANPANLLQKARPPTSQPVRPPIAMAAPQSHSLLPPSMPRSLAAVDPQIQLPNMESKVFDGTQFLKHPLSKADISSNSSDYDWSQPYDYPANCMQQGAGLARHSMHTSKIVDNGPSISTYSHTPPGYTQSHLTRASQSHNPSTLPTQTEQRLHSSMLMYDGGPVHLNATTLHAERDGRVVSRRNGFPVVDAPHARLLPTGAGISDGILPVPDIAANNLRVRPPKAMHETHPLHGGKVPAFVPEVRGSPAVVGNQMPPYMSNGHHYNEQNFRPQSAPSSLPPYVPHGQPPPSFFMSSMMPQGNSILWRPPPARSNHSRHFRPGWRED